MSHMTGTWSNPFFARFPLSTREAGAQLTFINPPTIDQGILLSALETNARMFKIEHAKENIRAKRSDSYNAAWEVGKQKRAKKERKEKIKQEQAQQIRVALDQNDARRKERNEIERWHHFIHNATTEQMEYCLDMGYFGWHYAETDFYGHFTGLIATAHYRFKYQVYVGRMKLWQFRQRVGKKELTCVDFSLTSKFIKEIPDQPQILMLAAKNPVLTIHTLPVTLQDILKFMDVKRRKKFVRKLNQWQRRFDIQPEVLLAHRDMIWRLGQGTLAWADAFSQFRERTQLSALLDLEGEA